MNIEKIESIIKLLKQYDLNKVCIESDSFKLEVHDYKNNVSFKNKNNDKQITDKTIEYVIKSPIVGSISIVENKVTGKKYAVGDKIQSGQTICTIEAMKMINEVNCNQDGIITEILIENNQFVEYEQPLFKIRERTKNV